jgi:hypothetical protein
MPAGAEMEERDPAAEAAMFAEVFREVLLVPFKRDSQRRRHHVSATLMAGGAAGTVLVGLDAVRASAARGEPREIVLGEFVRALSRATREREEAVPDLPVDEALDASHPDEIGPDAWLLELAALEFAARAGEAEGVDPDEAARCQEIADALRRLSDRHEWWFKGRDAAPPPDRRIGWRLSAVDTGLLLPADDPE